MVDSLHVAARVEVLMNAKTTSLCVTVTAWLFITANNALPYLGLGYDGSQTMFSDLTVQRGQTNHLFLPRIDVLRSAEYFSRVHVAVKPFPPKSSGAEYIERWLRPGAG